MISPDKIFGRLGNRMFQMAALHAYAKDNEVDWYFQDEKWFKKYEDDIRMLFSDNIGFLPYVAIHVRRGDYVNNPFYVDLSQTDYYEKAISLFPQKQFLVFSDDPDYCRTVDIFKGKDFQIMDRQDEISDFNLMASCENHIIANSSYSWWSAWLSPSPSKTVIAPKAWHPDGITRTVLPPEWKTL